MADLSFHSTGNSLPVPSVQALAGGSCDVPPRYIRPEVEAELISHSLDSELPIIDLGRLLDPRFTNAESVKLKFACEEWGFFQLTNHGVPNELMERMRADTMEFFRLPLEEKQAIAIKANNREGYGQAFVVSEEQKLDWADIIYLITRPLPARNKQLWPTHPPTFRATLDSYSLEVSKVAHCLMNLMAKNLGVDPQSLLNNFKYQEQGIRINYYPPCPKPGKVLGISPHTDATGLTLLLQISEVNGLQIKKSGKWFPVEPLPSAFIVNLGDILEVLSDGKYKSIEHRAIVDVERERLSIAAFHGPDHDSMVGPLPELVKGGEDHYKTVSYESYIKAYFSKELSGRSLVDSMMLN